MQKTIGILTGGGDAPGLNAVIRAVVKTATGEFGMRVVGIEDGFEGLLGETMTRTLSHCESARSLAAGWHDSRHPQSGNIRRTLPSTGFHQLPSRSTRKLLRISNGSESMRYWFLGGEGTLTIAAEFDRRGVPVVGVPKRSITISLARN